MHSTDDMRSSAPMPMPGPSHGHERERDRRRTRRGRHGSHSSSDDLSLSSSSSSSYLDISRWYPSFGRSGGVLKTFWMTPSERRQRARRRRSLKKKNRGIFGFGNNSSSSSVNSDMAYGMGFVKKPKSRNFSPRGEHAAGLERSDGRPAQVQRRQTDEEILEIGRKLAKVARDSNREDMRTMGKRPPSQFSAAQESWDKYSRQTVGGFAASSRGIAPSKHGRHSSSSSDDDEWESASEGEYSSDESNSGLAYGAAVDLGRSSPPKSSVSRQSTILSARPPEGIRPPDRKSSAVDPRLFGPVNSLRGLINTPCGFGDRNSVYTVPGPSEQRYAGSAGTAESASIEARPMQTVYPVQTSDPARVEAARASGSLVSEQQRYSAASREPSHSSRRPDPIPIQAPKPIAPVPTSMYDEQRIRDSEEAKPRDSRIRPSENKTFAETALVGAGVAALSAAIMAGRNKGKGKEIERDPESRHGRHERYGHDDHREEDTVVQDSRRAKELALEKEIERLERALSDRNKAREQRKRDSKRDSAAEPSGSGAADADREDEKRRRDRDSRSSEPYYDYDRPETSRRVSEPSEQPAAANGSQTRGVEIPAVPSSSGIDVFQFQVPDDAFRTRDSPLRAASPVIIDVTPAPSPPPDQMDRKSRRESFEDEMRDAKHIYDESMHSTAPISAVDMAAAIAATDKARHHDEPERGRTLVKTQDLVQEQANAYYHARRMAEREVSSRSRSKSAERSIVEKYDKHRDSESQGAEIVRIVTPPEMKQKPQKHKYSEPNADFRFDNLMSPKDLDHFRPHEYLVRDPSAERPRPYLNLVIPTPVPTPSPESQKKKPAKSKTPEPVVEEPKEVADVVISPRGEVVEAPQTPTSKRVSWGPSETQQYEVESPDRSSERNSRSYEEPRSPGKSSGWGSAAAAAAGIAAAAALSKKDDKYEPSRRDDRARESTDGKSSEHSRSPPSRKVLPKGTAPSRVLDEEPEDVPPAPGPKPASPRSSQMPGAFADDLDFAATLAAGLQDTGFDPNIVIEDAAYRRRDSPPGSNESTGVYMQPFSETVTDLGTFDFKDGSKPTREFGYVIGEVADTPASEKGSNFDWTEGTSRRQSKAEKRRSAGSDNIEVIEEPEEESPRLSKKEQRKIEKAARAAKLAEEQDRTSQPVEAGEDDWEESTTSKKSKRNSKKSKRMSAGWDDADTPVNDRRVSVPVDAFDDLEDTKTTDVSWEEPQRTTKSKRDSKGYDMPGEDPSDRRERRREERRRSDYEPIERDVASVVSDSRHDDRSNGRSRHQYDDDRSVVSAPDGKRDSKADKRSSKEEKRSSGGFWGILKGSNGVDGDKESKKDNAGTLGAGAGLAGAVAGAAIAAGSLALRSDAAEAPSEQEETRHVITDVDHPSERHTDSPSRGFNVFDFQDPEITPRVIKPAIDPQYGDLLPLPPSPSDDVEMDFNVGDDLPSLPDSRPATPPGQEKLLPRDRSESGQKRPGFAMHSRRRSAHETPLKSPSHTAIPISFRMGQRSSIPASPRVVSNPTSAHQSPAVQTQETFSSPSNKRSPRPPSWDRPTSWDSTREIKPLYLIERSAHAGGDGGELQHDDEAENTPLPPSRESPAPESEAGGDVEEAARSLESSPLFVDTAVANRTAPLGSQESTPKGLTQTDSGLPDSAREFGSTSKGATGPSHPDSGLPRSAKDVDMPFIEEPSQSPLPESSYATPTGSPVREFAVRPQVQRDESTESVSDFQDALDRPAIDEDIDRGYSQDISRVIEEEPSQKTEPSSVDKRDKQGYFSSAFSMLPAAGLVGVGALLGRGKRDDTEADVHDHPSQDAKQPAPKSPDLAGTASVVPEIEASEAVVTASSDLDDRGQAPLTASAGKSGPDTPLDTIESADASVPNDSPAAHMRPEGVLPISDLQQSDDAAHDVKGLEQERDTTDDTNVATISSSTQPDDNGLGIGPAQSSGDMETILETPADTVDWPEESRSKKKKGKKGKKKQSSIDVAPIPVAAEPSAIPSSDVQQDKTIVEGSPSNVIEGSPSALDFATASSPTWQPSEQPSQEDVGAGHKGDEAESPSASYHVLEDSGSKDLTDDPKDLHDTVEVAATPGAHSHSQSQDEEAQIGGSKRRSSSSTRRLRSSRSSMSPHSSADRYVSPDAFQSGDDIAASPRSASASARSSTGPKYKKTRSLRSSRRSSLASQGSGHGHEAGPSEPLAFEQPGTSFGEHFHETPEVQQDLTKQYQAVEENVPSTLEVVEQQVSSPLDTAQEPISAQLGVQHDPEQKTDDVVKEPASPQPELFKDSIERLGSPIAEDSQRGINVAEDRTLQESNPTAVEHTLTASPPKAEDESPDVLGPSSSQGPLFVSDEAVQPPSEPVTEGNLPEVQPRELSEAISQPSESEHAIGDDLSRQVEIVPSMQPVEQIEEQQPSGVVVESPVGGLSSPSSPPHAAQEASELDQSANQDLPESELQEPSPIPASTADDSPFTSKKSKKNKKKRKSSTVIGGAVQSSGTTTPGELELNPEPIESPVEPSTSNQDDVQLESSSTAKENPLELEQQPVSMESSDLQQLSKSVEPEIVQAENQDISRFEPEFSAVGKDKSPIEPLQTTDPTVLPVLDDVPAGIPISELEKPGLEAQQKSGDILDEDEIARREAEADQIRDEEAEISRLQSKKKLKPKEKTRLRELRANADRRAEEAAATTPIQEDVPEAQDLEKSIQEPVTESQIEETSLPVTEDPILAEEKASAGPSTVVAETVLPQSSSEPEDAVSKSMEIAGPTDEAASQPQEVAGTRTTSDEILPELDESVARTEAQSEEKGSEDPEEIARRETEAALIRDEETELARLESKKKPNKKDKVRMKVLRSNSERRAQEAEAAVQPQIEEFDTADLETPLADDRTGSISQVPEEDSSRDPVGQETREISVDNPRSLEDVIQTSDELSPKEVSQPHVDDSFKITEDVSRATNVDKSSQLQSQSHDLSQPQASDSPDEETKDTLPSQIEQVMAEQTESQVHPDSTQPDDARVPQILIEDTSLQPHALADESRASDGPQPQSSPPSLPQVEELATDPVETQLIKDNSGMPETQIEDSTEARHDDPALEVQEEVVAPGTHSGETSQVTVQEPALTSEISEENDKDVSVRDPAGEIEQPAVTELPQDPESEWPVVSKKSKKDKKKKRKGTLSEGSGQTSGSVTPFDAGEQSTVVESRGVTEEAPVSIDDTPQSGSFDQAEQPSASVAFEDKAAKDLEIEETAVAQPIESTTPEQQETIAIGGESFPAPAISDDSTAKAPSVEEAAAAPSLESSLTEQQETSLRTEDVLPAPGNSEETIPAIVPEPEQVPFNEEPEFRLTSKKSKRDKKKKRKNTISEDSSLPSGSATPIATGEPEQQSSLAEKSNILGGEQPVEERSLPLDVTQEPTPIPSATEETSATELPRSETAQTVDDLSVPHSVTEEPLSKSSTLEEASTSWPEPEAEPEPEPVAQKEPEFFTIKKSKKDKKRKKTLSGSGTITPMNDVDEATLPSEPAEIQEPTLGSIQHPSSPPLQPSEPERITSSDLVEDTPVHTEHADLRSPTQLPEIEALGSSSPLVSEVESSKDQLDQASQPGRKSGGWSFLAGAIAGAGVAAAVPEKDDRSSERDAQPEDITAGHIAGHSPTQTVETSTHAPSPSLHLADLVEIAKASDPKEEAQPQATAIGKDQPRNLSLVAEETGQSDDNVQEPKPIQEETLERITTSKEDSKEDSKEHQDKESASLDLDSKEVGLSSTQSPLGEDIRQEEVPLSSDLIQEPHDVEERLPDPQDSLQEKEATILEPQSPLDDWWTPASSSKKKKKKDKKRKSSSTPWSETASGAPTPVAEESSEPQDVISDANRRLEDLAVEPEPEPEFKAAEDRNIGSLDSEELPVSSQQIKESADRPSQEYDGSSPDFDPVSTEDFATPAELPSAALEDDAWATPSDGQPLELFAAKDSSNDNDQTGASPGRSLDLEPESSASVSQTLAEPADAPAEQNVEPAAEHFWEPIPKKMSKKEKRKAKKGSASISVPELTAPTPEGDSPDNSREQAPVALETSSQHNSPVLVHRSEPVAQDDLDKIDPDHSLDVQHTAEGQPDPSSLSQFDELSSSVPIDNEPLSIQPEEERPSQAQEIETDQMPILSRKMSKKEKRKAKKAANTAWEDDVVEPSQSQIPVTEETQVQDLPTTGPIFETESGSKEASQVSQPAEPQLAQDVDEDTVPSAAKDAAAEDEWGLPISRKKSKKDKKKKGKQLSSGSVSGSQTPAFEEAPVARGVEAIDIGEPAPEPSDTADQTLQDVSGIEGRNDRGFSEAHTSAPENSAEAHDSFDQADVDASAAQGRSDHRSAELYVPLQGADDEMPTEPSGDFSVPSLRMDHRSAELYVPGDERNFGTEKSTPIADDWDVPSDDASKNDNKATGSTRALSKPAEGARQDEISRTDAESSKFLRSPDSRGKELEKMQPSPDLWDDEDYFKPKPEPFVEPTQEPFSKFDIHPAVARGLAATPDKRIGEERPLVGLGLIHRHSSIFHEDEGHVPKLLTMTGDNFSTDSVAVQEAEAGPSGESSQLDALTRSDRLPSRPGSSRSYDEGLTPSPGKIHWRDREWSYFETGPAQGTNVPLARSVSPDKFNNLRPASPSLPKSPTFPPKSPTLLPKSPTLLPKSPTFPRSPTFPKSPTLPKSPQFPPRESSSFEDIRDKDLAKKGSVAALAERFGGSRKATGKTQEAPKHVDERTHGADDLFYQPAMWEEAESKPVQGSRLDVDSGDLLASRDTDLEEEQSDPDMQHSGQGAAATSHGREPTTPGSDNVSEPRSQPDLDAGTFTPQIPDPAIPEAEIPVESLVVESPVLGSQPSVEFPTDEQPPSVESSYRGPDVGIGLLESTLDPTLSESLDQPQSPSTPRSKSPVPEETSSFEEVRPTIETRGDDVPTAGPSVVDFSRSLPRALPSVQEEPHEEEAELGEHGALSRARAMTPDINRDSGVVTGSPVPPRVHQFESAQQQRDSGVHMRDPSGVSPRLLGTRGFSPQPGRLSHSSIEDEGANLDDKSSKRSSTAESETQRRFREATPVLEAQDPPVTPEPRKNRSKPRKYPDLGPSPGKAAAAAALTGGGALLAAGSRATRSRSPSPSPSPAASLRSVSDMTDELRSSAMPRQRRAASSNTGISRTRTPEPLNLRAESPSMLRHSGTPPLRSRRTRSGDLRSLSQLSNRSHSDLGAQASSSPASAANNAPAALAHLSTTPTPASSDLRRATTPAVVAQGTNNAPTANEGRVRTKDMADVYVSRSFFD